MTFFSTAPSIWKWNASASSVILFYFWDRVSTLAVDIELVTICYYLFLLSLFLYWKNPIWQNFCLSCKSSVVMNELHNLVVCGIFVLISLNASVRNKTLNFIYLIAVSAFFFCRYYDQLCSIEPKFPFSENQVRKLIKPLNWITAPMMYDFQGYT